MKIKKYLWPKRRKTRRLGPFSSSPSCVVWARFRRHRLSKTTNRSSRRTSLRYASRAPAAAAIAAPRGVVWSVVVVVNVKNVVVSNVVVCLYNADDA